MDFAVNNDRRFLETQHVYDMTFQSAIPICEHIPSIILEQPVIVIIF